MQIYALQQIDFNSHFIRLIKITKYFDYLSLLKTSTLKIPKVACTPIRTCKRHVLNSVEIKFTLVY